MESGSEEQAQLADDLARIVFSMSAGTTGVAATLRKIRQAIPADASAEGRSRHALEAFFHEVARVVFQLVEDENRHELAQLLSELQQGLGDYHTYLSAVRSVPLEALLIIRVHALAQALSVLLASPRALETRVEASTSAEIPANESLYIKPAERSPGESLNTTLVMLTADFLRQAQLGFSPVLQSKCSEQFEPNHSNFLPQHSNDQAEHDQLKALVRKFQSLSATHRPRPNATDGDDLERDLFGAVLGGGSSAPSSRKTSNCPKDGGGLLWSVIYSNLLTSPSTKARGCADED